jgi:hypothetical protein
MWALVRAIGDSSKTKVQDPAGFDRFHKVMKEACCFSGYLQASCETKHLESLLEPMLGCTFNFRSDLFRSLKL